MSKVSDNNILHHAAIPPLLGLTCCGKRIVTFPVAGISVLVAFASQPSYLCYILYYILLYPVYLSNISQRAVASCDYITAKGVKQCLFAVI